jgi:hypothetical protein
MIYLYALPCKCTTIHESRQKLALRHGRTRTEFSDCAWVGELACTTSSCFEISCAFPEIGTRNCGLCNGTVQEQNHMLGGVRRITDEMMLSGHTAMEIEEKIT